MPLIAVTVSAPASRNVFQAVGRNGTAFSKPSIHSSQRMLAFEFYLENWRATIVHIKCEGDPLRMLPVLVGSVAGHPRLGEGRTIRTSQLIWLDRNRKWART